MAVPEDVNAPESSQRPERAGFQNKTVEVGSVCAVFAGLCYSEVCCRCVAG